MVHQLGKESYDASDWDLFIDCSKRSLKAVLLHNGNSSASMPITHSVHLKETYENLRIVLEEIKYHKHSWYLYGSMKVLGMLLGQQGGYTKLPCLLCDWIPEQGTYTGQQKTGLKGKICFEDPKMPV